MAEGDIEVYGAIRAQTAEGKAVYASQVYDEAQGKFQSQINQETANDGLVSAKVAQTFNEAEKEQARNNIGAIDKTAFYFSDINTSDITEGTLTGTVKTKLIALRNEAATNDTKLVTLQGGETDVVATIESFGSTFQMWFIEKGRRCEVTADPSNTTWTAHWTEMLESITQQEFNAIFN